MARGVALVFLVLPLCACSDRGPAPPSPAPPGPAAAAPAAPDLATALRHDSDGLVVETAADGSSRANLGGRFQHAPIVYRQPDGTLVVGCANEEPLVRSVLGGQAPSGAAPRPKLVQ